MKCTYLHRFYHQKQKIPANTVRSVPISILLTYCTKTAQSYIVIVFSDNTNLQHAVNVPNRSHGLKLAS